MDYEVKKIDERDIPTGKKLKLAIFENKKKIFEQWVSFSNWQLKEGLKDRIKQWTKDKINNIKNDSPDIPNKVKI